MRFWKHVLQEQAGDTPPGSPPASPPGSPPAAPPPAAPPASPPVGKWSDTWRQEIAGDNADALKTLERFATPADMWQSYNALRQKMSSGELKPFTPFPEKGTDQEKNAWRQANGIPESPDKYELKLKDGLVIGEADKPIIDNFLKSVHAKNMAPEHASAAVQWYFDEIAAQERAAAEKEAEDKKTTEATLLQRWGGEYRQNLNNIDGLLDANLGADSPLKAGIKKSLETNPELAVFFESVARQVNPMTTLTGAGNTPAAIDTEIARIKGYMDAPRGTPESDKYWKDEALQARYRELLAAQERLKARA